MLDELDQSIFSFLDKNANTVPQRLVKWIAYYYPDARIRKKYLARMGVCMGENTFSNFGLKVVANENNPCVIIGNNVSLAPDIVFVCESGANNGREINTLPYVKEKLTKSQNIVVEDEAWIGANVTILPGVRIGRCSVIGAGSVVTRDVEPYSIYAGVPAKKIRDLKTGERVE